VFDWGSIPAQQPFEHVFVLHNDGDRPLTGRVLMPSEVLPDGYGAVRIDGAGLLIR
jgi:hypothetical protein